MASRKSSAPSKKRDKVVLAYSGGLDTSVAIRWLQEKYNLDVISVSVDVGQPGDMEENIQRAKVIGSLEAYAIDAREEFAEDYVFPCLKANALYMQTYPMATSIARPLIAKLLVEIAQKEGAKYIAHGCTAKGNDQVRFDVSINALDPSLKIIAPMREWVMTREDEIEYAKEHDIPIKVKKACPYSTDENLWGRSCECGVLEDAWAEPPEDAFEWTIDPTKAPNEPKYVTIKFEKGVPVGTRWQEDEASGPHPEAQPDRWGQRCRSHRPDRGPLGRDQVQGDIRVPGGGGADRRPQGPGEDGAHQGRGQLQAHRRAEVCGAML